jgi:hypothetical protein
MGYHIIMFDPEAAPAEPEAFGRWISEETTWDMSGDQPAGLDPKTASAILQGWFMEVLRPYPPLHGPYALPGWHDKPGASEYRFAAHLAEIEVPTEKNEEAFTLCLELAQKMRLGLYDSGSRGEVWMPREGELHAVTMTVERVVEVKEQASGSLLGRLFRRRA